MQEKAEGSKFFQVTFGAAVPAPKIPERRLLSFGDCEANDDFLRAVDFILVTKENIVPQQKDVNCPDLTAVVLFAVEMVVQI